MQVTRFSSVMDELIKSRFMDIHTAVPAKISSVNYGSGTASVTPVVKTKIGLGKSVAYPEMFDVPLFILSGGGKARITFPVKAGDTVIVIFSERDPSGFLNGSSNNVAEPVQGGYAGLFPLGILPCISNAGSAKAISQTDVVLENDKAVITLKPDGTITQVNANSSITQGSDGKIEMKAGGGTLTMTPDGTVNINGFIVTPTGQVRSSTGVDLDTHRHRDVQSGTGTSGTPVI